MKDLLFILVTLGLTTCHDASYNDAKKNGGVGESFGNKNSTSSTANDGASDFMSDSRFGRGGGSGGGTSSWSFPSTTARSRIVETKYGRVQGLSVTLFTNIQHTSRNFPLRNKIVEIFFSIPYAAPPIKSHRFSPTQTPIPWNDVRATIHPSAVCPQIFPDIRNESAALKEMPKGYLEYLRRVEPYLRNQSEDCLYLNIFSPIGPDPKPKPVLVYIHGGMFAWGSGNLSDGTVLAAYSDVIFVSLNYRLSILGFLNLNESPSTKPRVSNYGLMDQIAALHWIKENIRNFGGDPDNITLMGYEAGAACINFLMSSPTVTPGLFHRSILIAGSSHAPWALISDPSVAAFTVAQTLNCSSGGNTSSTSFNNSPHAGPGGFGGGHGPLGSAPGEATTTTQPSRESHHLGISSSSFSPTTDPVLECLRSKHYSEFTKFTLPKFSVDFGPSVDGIVIKPNFKSGMPSGQMGKRETNKKYDLMFGLSSLEKLTEFSEIDLEFGFESLRRDAILRTLVRNSFRYHRNEILATIINEYIDWEKSVQHPITTRDMAVNAVTDCLSLAPVVAVSDSSQIRKSFFYVFEHATRDGLYNYQRAGAGGGEELNYLFGYPLVEAATGQVLPFIPAPLPSNYSKGEIALSELWLTFVSNFVHSGNPNGPIKIDSISSWPVSKERNRYKNTAWESYDRLHQKYLEIGANKIRTRSHYRAHQMAIWLRLVPELQRSGAQMASSYHNRMRGGNDPGLYTGRLKQPEEEIEETPEMTGGSPLNPAQLYDLLLGYGYGLLGYNGPGESQSVPELVETPYDVGGDTGFAGAAGRLPSTGDTEITNKNHTSIVTTCYSPVLSSSVQQKESSAKGAVVGGGGANAAGAGQTFSGTGSLNETSSSSFFDSTYFPPYSIILAITIAVGCSLLILNISIFTLFYFQRGRRRGKMMKAQQQHDSEQQLTCNTSTTPTSNKYSEPPELLKSNRTTASSFLHNSNSQSQFQAELEALELTVKQHQQELLGEKALLGIRESLSLGGGGGGSGSASGTDSVSSIRQSGFPMQQQQLQNSYSTQNVGGSDYYRVETSSLSECSPQRREESRHLPLSPTSSSSHHGGSSAGLLHAPTAKINSSSQQTLAVATLPRCNGSIGGAIVTTVGGGPLSSFMAPSNAQTGHTNNGSSSSSGGGGSVAPGKPHPPPRAGGTMAHFSTLPHHPYHHGSLKREKRIDYGDNSDSNNENDELKV